MFAKSKTPAAPSDAQAREKLALYVYEYLLHVGAEKAAQTFLNEIRWEKHISLGDPPGFLHSWWCVFWDLYCAAPDRRDSCSHSNEGKAFHDYGFVHSGYSVNGMPPHHGPPLLPPNVDPNRPPGPHGMGGPRMAPPRGHMGPGGMGPYGPPMRLHPPPGGPLPPMNSRLPWPPTSVSSVMSPGGGYHCPPGPPTNGEPIPTSDGMYDMMKPPSGGPMSGEMCPTSEAASIGSNGPGSSGSGPPADGVKSSPSNDPGTPSRQDSGSMSDMMGGYSNGENDQNESEAIQKIKESMQEEAKRFEKDPDYYMQ